MDNPTDPGKSQETDKDKPSMSSGEALGYLLDRYLQRFDDNYRDFESIESGAATTMKNFSSLDKDGNGFLATNEIDLAENDPLLSKQFSKSDKDFLASVRKHQYDVETLSSDGFTSRGKGVSYNDLKTVLDQSRKVREDIRQANRIRGFLFSDADADKNEAVTHAELDRQLTNPRLSAEQKQTIYELKQANVPGYFGMNRTNLYDYARKFDGDSKYGVLRSIANDMVRRKERYE
ncbi:MAG: hypothetical protein K2Z81_11585 [Cyanobacteria bacterium]|nr:hypothetical protein [Cyanobacteriota bacterium]